VNYRKKGKQFPNSEVIKVVTAERIRILVIDDDYVDRIALVRQLKVAKIPMEIHEADSSLQGKQLVKSLELDCIIIDYLLPDGNGIEFINFLHSQNILIPVIMLTGQGDEMVAVESMKAGAVDYLVKGSIKPEMLLQAIFASVRLSKAQAEAQTAIKKAVQAEKMAFLGTMFAGIAHEINQPLNAIKLTAGVLLFRYRQGEVIQTNKILDAMETIHSRCERIEGIINDVRTFVRTDYAPARTSCNMNQAVLNVLDMLHDKIIACEIAVHKDLLTCLPDIWGEMQRLEEIITNIIINAVHVLEDSSHPDKNIYIKTSWTDCVQLEISDNGSGIEDSIRENIFEPFFTTKNSGKGMGLGLAIVQSAVVTLGGKISCKNNEYGGATFYVSLPAYHENI
jgi:signal transduction histidine kinase